MLKKLFDELDNFLYYFSLLSKINYKIKSLGQIGPYKHENINYIDHYERTLKMN